MFICNLLSQFNIRGQCAGFAHIITDTRCPNEVDVNSWAYWAYYDFTEKRWTDSFGLTVKCISGDEDLDYEAWSNRTEYYDYYDLE